MAFESSPSGQLIVSPTGRVEAANRRAAEILGRSLDDLPGRFVDEFIPPRLRLRHRLHVAEYVKRPTARPMGAGRDLFALRGDGSEVPVEVGLSPVQTDGQVHFVVSLIDISARRRAEAQFHAALESTSCGLLMVDARGRVVVVNSRIESIFGYSADELIGRPVESLLPEGPAAAHAKLREKFAADPTARPMGAGRDLFGRRKDGRLVPLEIGLNPCRVGDETFVLASVADISERLAAERERRDLERQVEHAQRVQSLGLLAGGIAHDFNNLLVAMRGYRDLAAGAENETARETYLERVAEAIEAASTLARQLLDYAGKSSFSIERLDLNALIRESLDLLRATLSKRAGLEVDLCDEAPVVKGDAGRLRQILMNLAINGSDALEGRDGKISVKTTVRRDPPIAGRHEYPAGKRVTGPHVVLEVSDTGVGMAPETARRVFEPFFSTKSGGRGLGLATVYGILRAHGGGALVDSRLGIGTTFEVLLPLVDDSPPAEDAAPTRRILVVDDEAMVRDLVRAALESVGREVIEAGDGVEALEIMESSDEIALVLLDSNLPRLDGAETLRRIRARRPDLPVIVTSGRLDESFVAVPGVRFLPKPFTPRGLRAAIREVLEEEAPGCATNL